MSTADREGRRWFDSKRPRGAAVDISKIRGSFGGPLLGTWQLAKEAKNTSVERLLETRQGLFWWSLDQTAVTWGGEWHFWRCCVQRRRDRELAKSENNHASRCLKLE